jgi:hypothetical protein
MRPSRDLGDNTAVKTVGIYLRRDYIGKRDESAALSDVADNSGTRFVTGCFYS